MRTAVLLLAGLLLACAGCGARQSSPAFPDVAFKPLTEDDVALVLSARALLDSLYHQTWYATPHFTPLDNTAMQWAKMVDSLGAAKGVKAAFAAQGIDWSSFRSAAYRILATINAIASTEQPIPDLKQGMGYLRAGERDQIKARLAELKSIADRTPQRSIDVFRPHQRELLDIFYWLLPN